MTGLPIHIKHLWCMFRIIFTIYNWLWQCGVGHGSMLMSLCRVQSVALAIWDVCIFMYWDEPVAHRLFCRLWNLLYLTADGLNRELLHVTWTWIPSKNFRSYSYWTWFQSNAVLQERIQFDCTISIIKMFTKNIESAVGLKEWSKAISF